MTTPVYYIVRDSSGTKNQYFMYQLLKMNILLWIVIDIGDSIHYLEVGGGV